jgi:hypothetical protein
MIDRSKSHRHSGCGPRTRFVHTTLSLATLSMQPWLASIALLMAPAPPPRCAITHFQTMLLAFQICGAPRLRMRSTWSASWAIPRRFGPRLCSACYRISFTVTLARTACQSAIRSGIMWSALSTDCVQTMPTCLPARISSVRDDTPAIESAHREWLHVCTRKA